MKFRIGMSVILATLGLATVAVGQEPLELPQTPFSQEYIAEYSDYYDFSVPEAFELANILIVMTEWGRADEDGNFFLKTDYARQVYEHFDPYSDHPIFEELNKVNLKMFDNLIGLRENSFAFYFEGDSLQKLPFFDKYRDSDWVPALWDEHRVQIEDFARVSAFRSFYAAHRDFYKQQAEVMRRRVDLHAIHGWLELHFPMIPYNCYYIMFSPLTRGQHSLGDMFGDGLNQVLAVVAGPHFAEVSSMDARAVLTRMVFTEVDHAYVNPTTYIHHHERIQEVLKDSIDYWRSPKGGSYRSPDSLFNEMMTWGVFLVYANEKLPDDLEMTKRETIERMQGRRGFPRFGEFYEQLQLLYDERAEGEVLPDILDDMLDWMQQAQSG